MATTKFYLDTRGRAKDGRGSVLLMLYHNNTSASFPTKVRLSVTEWNGGKLQGVPGSEAINANLQNLKSRIDREIAMLSLDDGFEMMTASQVKRIILDGKAKSKGHLVSDIFNEYVKYGGLSDGTIAIYNTTLKKILDYAGNIKIESINLKWLRSFDNHLSKTQTANGRSIYLRSLRAVCNYSRHIGVMRQYPFDNFQIRQEPTRKRNITVEDLRRFRDYPTSQSNVRYRDYFFLSFYLIGINSKDLLLARKSQIVNGRLEYIREKTHKKYSVKIEPEADEIISRYQGKGDYLLDAMDSCKLYRSFAHEWNDALKTIGDKEVIEIPDMDNLFGEPELVVKINPVIPGISTYYSRHTWATLAAEIDISSDIISQALGHSGLNRTTMIYIKPNRDKVDEANRMVIDYLNAI